MTAVLAAVVLSACTSTTAGHLKTSGPSSGLSSSSTATSSTVAAYTDPATIRTVVADASRDVVDANSYDYRRLDAFRSAAEAAATGDFRRRLDATLKNIIGPLAPRTRTVQHAAVNAIGVSSLGGGTARLLAFVQLTVTNTSSRTPRINPYAATLSVQLVSGRWRISALSTLSDAGTGGGQACDPPGSRALKDACTAAAKGAELLATYSRAHFDRDVGRALAATTGTLHAQVSSNRTATLNTITRQKVDLTARTRSAAVQSVSPRSVVVLVALDGYRSTTPTVPNAQMLRVTVVRSGSRWLLSDVESVAIR